MEYSQVETDRKSGAWVERRENSATVIPRGRYRLHVVVSSARRGGCRYGERRGHGGRRRMAVTGQKEDEGQ